VKWQKVFPPGGDFMPAAAEFFSPLAVWTRFSHQDSNALFFLITQAVEEYTNIYMTNLRYASPETNPALLHSRRQGLEKYLRFRSANDPAKSILINAFGKDWTQVALDKVLFPIDQIR
jgi:hypothetical protein